MTREKGIKEYFDSSAKNVNIESNLRKGGNK